MPLDYVDFAHHYEGQGLTEDQGRAHFETLADLLDCIVRLFWPQEAVANKLGITLHGDLKLADGSVALNPLITSSFNDAALLSEAERQES